MSLQITLEIQDVQTILAGLAELPMKHSLDTWAKVKTQAEQQLAAAQPAPPVPEPPAPDVPQDAALADTAVA